MSKATEVFGEVEANRPWLEVRGNWAKASSPVSSSCWPLNARLKSTGGVREALKAPEWWDHTAA